MGFTNTSGSTQADKRIFLKGIQIKGGDIEFTSGNDGAVKVNKLNPISGNNLTIFGGLSVSGGLSVYILL